MNTNDIRRTYIEFFEGRDHRVMPSASLIPVDPALLLNVAGMVPFKSFLLGEEPAPYPRMTTSQKCIRTEDIDILGTTARHLSFFEMLGNFSIGDYFKERAIALAWELSVEKYGLDPDRIWVTVHESDDEAAEIWLDGVGIRPDRLQRRDRDNIWQMGVPGPAGKSSELFYDKGSKYGPDGGPIVDEERFMEYWNLVFMAYIQDEPYNLVGELPMKSIDTGMGLERVSTLLQGVDSVFDTTTLRAVLATAENETSTTYGADDRSDVSLRIMADHGRAVTFLISDGVVPSNEGRGYILRRLLRRAVRHAHMLGTDSAVMEPLIDTTTSEMGDAFPALVERQDFIKEMADREESQFLRTLATGEQLLDAAIEELEDDASLPGATAFKLHDTFGFPVELTTEIVLERGLKVDMDGFEIEMAEQKRRARAAFDKDNEDGSGEIYRKALASLDQTQFIGYDHLDGAGQVLSLLSEGESAERVEEGQQVEVFLDVSPFYAESGGQVGDTGVIRTETGEIRIDDTQFSLPEIRGHRGTVSMGHVRTGQEATTHVNPRTRETTKKNHTGTHILHWALRDVLGDHVHQAGSLVAPDRLRFDFSHHEAVDREHLHHIERVTNERIIENGSVTTVETSKTEAEKMGAIAFFGDKYGETVRVVQTGNFSTEFCGGTHVPTTGQVGPLVLVSEGSVGSNIRRVEALTGAAAYGHLSGLRDQLFDVASALKAQPGREVDAALSTAEKLKMAEERLADFEQRDRAGAADALVTEAEKVGDSSLSAGRVDALGGDGLRSLAFQVRDRLGSGIGVFGSVTDGKAALIVFASEDLVAKGVSAGEIAAAGAAALGGGGSRDPKLAQAGGPNSDGMDEAISIARTAAHEALSTS
ncbi:MAG: alanine--tRNA ligase [Acidimicrobiia bacterium]